MTRGLRFLVRKEGKGTVHPMGSLDSGHSKVLWQIAAYELDKKCSGTHPAQTTPAVNV